MNGKQPHVSCDPPGTDREKRVPALPGPCSHHGTQDREAAKLPERFSPRTVPAGSSWPNFFYDRQVLFHRHSCRPATGNHPGANHMSYIKKAREWPAPKGIGQLLVSSSLYFVSFDFRKLLLPYDPISGHFCLSKMTHSHLGSQSFPRTA